MKSPAPGPTTAKRWKQPERPSTDKWISKMCSSHTTECYSALKNGHTLTWRNLEDVMLRHEMTNNVVSTPFK